MNMPCPHCAKNIIVDDPLAVIEQSDMWKCPHCAKMIVVEVVERDDGRHVQVKG